MAKKEEGKLRREPIPDDLVVDKSNSEIIHTLVNRTRDVYKGPQYLLDHKDEPGLKLTDDSWISTDGKVTSQISLITSDILINLKSFFIQFFTFFLILR